MARIASVNLPNDKKVNYALTAIYGLGLSTATKIVKDLKLDENVRIKDMSEEDINKLRVEIEKQYRVEGDLKREVLGNIKRLKEINAYRGTRHSKNLPARGQRTKTNSRTNRGNRRVTVGSGRKPSAQKT